MYDPVLLWAAQMKAALQIQNDDTGLAFEPERISMSVSYYLKAEHSRQSSGASRSPSVAWGAFWQGHGCQGNCFRRVWGRGFLVDWWSLEQNTTWKTDFQWPGQKQMMVTRSGHTHLLPQSSAGWQSLAQKDAAFSGPINGTWKREHGQMCPMRSFFISLFTKGFLIFLQVNLRM